MFSLLTCFRSCPSLQITRIALILLLFELNFILFELSFEAEVGEYSGSAFSDEGDGFLETPGMFFHDVCDD